MVKLADLPKEKQPEARRYWERAIGVLLLLFVITLAVLWPPWSPPVSVLLCSAWLAALGAWLFFGRRFNKKMWGPNA